MTIFVRKISKAKWPSEEEIAEKALDSEIIPFVRADALTTCLKTSQNTLSVWTVEGWLYLAAVKDLYTKQVVGYSLNERMTTQLVCNA
ncbi:hypothetical protein LDY24_17900, partial [Acinetobacter baumannii]|nr:hypothetical protein [Acinetobacter baumannii]